MSINFTKATRFHNEKQSIKCVIKLNRPRNFKKAKALESPLLGSDNELVHRDDSISVLVHLVEDLLGPFFRRRFVIRHFLKMMIILTAGLKNLFCLKKRGIISNPGIEQREKVGV